MMFSRAASLRRLAAPAASSLLRPAAAASSPLSTTAKRAPKKAAVPAPEAAAATASQQKARDRPPPPHFDPAKVKRPAEIPFQLQFANTVHLVGTIGVLPVLEEKSPGEYQAVSVIIEKKDSVENVSSQLRIPVIFQGDLTLIAACHLKENDLVYIVGQLSLDEATTSHSKIQILARSLSFVESNSRKDDKMVPEQDKKMASRKDDKMLSEQDKKMASQKDEKMVSEQDKKMASDHPAEENPRTRPFWNDLLSNPHNWWDNRATMTIPSSAAFKHKDKGQLLWLNEFTPKDVLSKLDTLAFYNSTPKKNEISGNVKNESWWTDVFANPGDWNDNRINKQNGTVGPRYPDFNHKCSRQSLWLDSAPGWVQSKLDGLKLVGSSDLTHDSTSKSIYDVNDGNKTLLPNKEKDGNVKNGNLWTDVFANPGGWKDNRINKQNGTVNPRYPDFTNKSSGQALWLDSSPGWVQSKLDDLKTFGTSDSSPDFTSKNVYDVNDGKKTILLNKKKDEDLWKDVIENPTNWWDNRLKKRNPRAPDFKHKDSGVALWLSSSPSWVLEKLPPAESTTNTDW